MHVENASKVFKVSLFMSTITSKNNTMTDRPPQCNNALKVVKQSCPYVNTQRSQFTEKALLLLLKFLEVICPRASPHPAFSGLAK